MKVLSLQGRIIILLTLFAIFTIASFIVVQLTHELEMINRYKESEALIFSLAVENIWERVSNLKIPQEMKLIFLQKKLNLLKEPGNISRAYILNADGRIVSSTESGQIGQKGDSDDAAIVYKVNRNEAIKEKTIVDKKNQEFSFYFPLGQDQENKLVVRMFFPLGDIQAALKNVYIPGGLIGMCIVIINVILGVFLSRLVVGPIKFFNDAATKIAKGRLDLRVSVHTSDELEELAETFNFMTSELQIMKDRAENANPLTKLPGNIVIMDQVQKRIKEGRKFVVIYSDLDNFKAFNDKYGIHKGDDAIKITGDILKKALAFKGNPDDFIGHEGGDDFILLTTPECAQGIAGAVISEFDKKIRSLYDKEDLGRGYIVAHSRDGSVKQFPLMTISLAGVTNAHRPIQSYAQITNIAAEVKKKAKMSEKSIYVLDMRKG
jgi:diguanylate cyclase (GGDEF)-like protein